MKTKEPLVTVIIPFYNKEYAIEHTLNSIKNQLFKNFEVLLIDDGSTDRSSEICDRFQAEDNRFFVIHKRNGGVSSARNLGLEKMKGKYVFFCDADDELPADALSSLVTAQEKSGAELVIGGFAYKNIKTGNVGAPYKSNRQEHIISIKDLYKYADMLWQENNMLTSCTRLYLSEIIRFQKLRFDESLIVLEDFDFVLSYLKYVNKIHSIKECTYYQILGYGINSYRAKIDYIDDVKTVYEKYIRFLEHNSISQRDIIMREINLVITEDLKNISTDIPIGILEHYHRKRRSKKILSMNCVQEALKNVKWDKKNQEMIDSYGIEKWLSGVAVSLEELYSDYSYLKANKGIIFSLLWKWRKLLNIYFSY